MILKFIQGWRKLAVFPLLLAKFCFSQVNVFIACRLSKIYLQSETKVWFYLVQNVRFSVLKTVEFLFRRKGLFLDSSCS